MTNNLFALLEEVLMLVHLRNLRSLSSYVSTDLSTPMQIWGLSCAHQVHLETIHTPTHPVFDKFMFHSCAQKVIQLVLLPLTRKRLMLSCIVIKALLFQLSYSLLSSVFLPYDPTVLNQPLYAVHKMCFLLTLYVLS